MNTLKSWANRMDPDIKEMIVELLHKILDLLERV